MLKLVVDFFRQRTSKPDLRAMQGEAVLRLLDAAERGWDAALARVGALEAQVAYLKRQVPLRAGERVWIKNDCSREDWPDNWGEYWERRPGTVTKGAESGAYGCIYVMWDSHRGPADKALTYGLAWLERMDD